MTPSQVLNSVFGYDNFRDNQKEVIESVLAGNDTLAIMPTGGGKSLCYQVPALIFSGLTVVVSPLIALMEDQVSQLKHLGIGALFLNSSLDWETYCENMRQVRLGDVKLLYVAPETLASDRIQELLSTVEISCLTIDEAHCISEWGHDFRPEYRMISIFRKRMENAVCLALTATATENVRKDIKKTLNMKESKEFISSFDRKNIFLEVESRWTKRNGGAENQVLEFVKQYPNESGIIYCFSRKQVDELTKFLHSKKMNVLPYHAGLSDNKRTKNQNLFVSGKCDIMVATVAFGMGINKSNVRYVLHYDLPKSLEQYYQEIGRAGRDGLPSKAKLLYSRADIRKIQYFWDEKEQHERLMAEKQLSAMLDYAETYECRRKVLLRYFGEKYEEKTRCGCDSCDVCAFGPILTIDVTILVQKILSCIIRTQERYGTSYIVDILLGSKSKRILENRHEKLSTWGIGKECSREDWFELTRLLIEEEYLKKSIDFAVLSLTNKAKETLTERKKVMLPFKPRGKV